ncbi:TAXI family TRAP transporter solute-binding subunit [Halomonas sp. A29]|uniref:TAXI family TRAP transporter solute-binding subunit n=1 Tax=Halomonas sp. A29 TaxID=3102786 RepID=UPI00398ACC46
MHKRQFLKSALCLATAGLLGITATGVVAQENGSAGGQYIMGTATTGGTFYPVGVALSTLVRVKLEPTHDLTVSAISSAGSAENLRLMEDGQAQFGILQALYGAWAWNGSGPVPHAYDNIRSVSMLWQNVEHFVMRSDRVDTGTIDDLAHLYGRGFSIGARNSGTEGSGRQILAGLDIDPEQMNLAYLGYGPSADSMQNGNIDGMNVPAGVPASAVTSAFANMGSDISLLSVSQEQLERINREYPVWTPFEIPAGTYPGQAEAVHTIAQPNILVVNADVPEEHVYQITKAMFENLPFLHNIHPATRDMALEKALDGLPMPLHPGAARYFQEQGLEIPEHLLES